MTGSNRIGRIEDTSARDPLLHVVGAFGGTDRYVAEMESAGQRQLVNSDRLPTDIDDRSRKGMLELGFVLGDPDPADPLFMPVTLPEGWSRQGSDHAMGSYIVDQNGRKRVSIFYKAAFYDRSAHASLISVEAAANELLWGDDKTLVVDEWTTVEAWTEAFTKIRDRELAEAEERDEYYPKGAAGSRERAAQCDDFLKQLAPVFYVHRDESGVDLLAYRIDWDGTVSVWSEKYGWHESKFHNLCDCSEYDRAHFADHLVPVTVDALPVGAR
jgi:hypothetical protein